MVIVHSSDYLEHHGILGQKWGHRNGPPYPLDSSQASSGEKKAGFKESRYALKEEKLKYKIEKNKAKAEKKERRKYIKSVNREYDRKYDAKKKELEEQNKGKYSDINYKKDIERYFWGDDKANARYELRKEMLDDSIRNEASKRASQAMVRKYGATTMREVEQYRDIQSVKGTALVLGIIGGISVGMLYNDHKIK